MCIFSSGTKFYEKLLYRVNREKIVVFYALRKAQTRKRRAEVQCTQDIQKQAKITEKIKGKYGHLEWDGTVVQEYNEDIYSSSPIKNKHFSFWVILFKNDSFLK